MVISFRKIFPFLLLISFASFLNILARTIFSPLTPSICEEMNLGHSDTGNLFLILSLGFAITLFFSQFLSSWISHKKTVVLSILTTGLALMLTSYSHNFDFFRLALFLIGLSSGLFIPSAVAMIRQVAGYTHLGKAFGIFATAQSFAFIFSPLIVDALITMWSWQEILYAAGIFFTGISFAFALMFKQGEEKGAPIDLNFAKSVFSWPSFWILAALLCLANGLNIGIYNMAPDYFQRHNLIEGKAVSQLVVIARVISIGTAVLAGVFADRFGLKRSIVVSLILCGMITMLMGSIDPSASLVLFCIQSPIATCLMPLIHFAMATIVPAERNAAIVSIMAPFGFMIGAGVVPQVLGFLGDFNLYAEGFVLFGVAAILSGAWFNLNRVYGHVKRSQADSVES